MSYAAITPRQGYKVLATELLNREKGIVVRGERTLAFGFLPQLLQDKNGPAWKRLFIDEIKKIASTRPLASK